jgi:hyperosmotically inducible protein
MNTDILEGKWKQLRGRMKETWGKLTDDDLDRVDGRLDRLSGLLQAKYGYARDKADAEVKRLFSEYETPKASKAVSVLLAALLLAGAGLSGACATTDAGLTSKVKSKLVADGSVPASQINVDTRNKVVTLTGSVDSQTAKDQAILLAKNTAGVRDVVDMISVKEASGEGNAPEPDRTIGEHIDDAGITMAVKGRLLEDEQVKGLRIDVDTREGVVYLTGTVRSAAEKDRATSLARDTKHVKDVVSNLTIEKS